MRIIERGPCERYNKTATPIAVEGVLLHTTEGGGMEYLDRLFIDNVRQDGGGKTTTVSVHFCIFKNGAVHSYAPWQPGRCYYTYHAGQSWMPDGRASASRYLIGIELQHMAGELYTDAQMDSLYELLAAITGAWRGQPSWRGLLLRHREVAPARKTDPTRPFDQQEWPVLKAWWDGQQSGQEDDMTDKQSQMLEEIHLLMRQDRVTNVTHSNDARALLAQIRGNAEEADQLLTDAYIAGLKEKRRLGFKLTIDEAALVPPPD